MEKMKPKKVWTKKGTGLLLAKRFSVSPAWVSKALNGEVNSQTAHNIRAVAVREYGGFPVYE